MITQPTLSRISNYNSGARVRSWFTQLPGILEFIEPTLISPIRVFGTRDKSWLPILTLTYEKFLKKFLSRARGLPTRLAA
jgi:hypothetical protein